MALRLRVISEHRQRMGDKSSFVFGVSGGSIGRSAENDWVLPDDMRYVSGRHARIVFHKGRYLLQDTSSNGTYINDNERPLGNQNPHELKCGDILRIGEYHVQVQIDSATDFSLDDSALYKRNRRLRPARAAAYRRRTWAPRCGSRTCSKRATTFPATSSSRSMPLGKPSRRGRERSYRRRTCPRSPPPAPSSTRTQQWRDASRGWPGPPKRPNAKRHRTPWRAPTAPAPAPAVVADSPAANNTPGLQAFCRGAGIGPETLPVDAHARMLHLAGQLLRESLLGLKESNRSQQEQRNQLRVTYEKEQHTDLVPSLDRHSVEELIQDLLKAHDSRRFDAVQWLRSSFMAGRQHEDAVLRAMFAAFIDFIGRLDPARSGHAFRAQRAPQDHGQLGVVRRVLPQPVRNPARHAAAHFRGDLRAELRPGGARDRRGHFAFQRRRLTRLARLASYAAGRADSLMSGRWSPFSPYPYAPGVLVRRISTLASARHPA